MKTIKKLPLTPLIHSHILSDALLDELSEYFESFVDWQRPLDQDNVIYIDWEDGEGLTDFKKYLLDEYGNKIKKYEYIVITQLI